MTLPVDIILDLHQNGLRVHLNTDNYDEVRITGTHGEAVSILPQQVKLLIDWLKIADHVIAQRLQGDVPCRVED